GNEYAQKALDLGASFAIIDEKQEEEDVRFILVENVLSTLQNLATHHRRQFDIPIIGITGTNGKTTTKELLATVLQQKFKVHFTQGNFNNHIGVPLTLLSMPMEIEIAIIEMGANHKEDIAELCEIAEPNFGLVTNVGKAHLEGFGGLEGVKYAKGAMYRYLGRNQGLAFVNINEPNLIAMSRPCERRQFYGEIPMYLLRKEASPFVNISLENLNIQTQLIGLYNTPNILTAIQIGRYFHVEDKDIKFALEDYSPNMNRSQLVRKYDCEIILDAYNANPTSMRAALDNFENIKTDKKKIVVLGDMLELGNVSQEEHQEIQDYVASLNFDVSFLIGKEFSKITSSAYENIQTLKEIWDWNNIMDSLILIKGSRGIRLESLLEKDD
ncbi:MAG: UDP-N-acetylmuramoyl-tripeptide--D-alanyl-D-alanine ligase, partial [Saprospiraceae bacterium]